MWTPMYIYLRANKPTLQFQSLPDPSNENLTKLSELFEAISNLCIQIFKRFERHNTANEAVIKKLLFNSIFDDEMKAKLNQPLKHYCQILINSFEQESNNEFRLIFEKLNNIMSSCSITIENAFIEIFMDVLKEYIKNIISCYNNDYDVNVMEKIFQKNSDIIESKVIPSLFPQTFKNGDLKLVLSNEFFHSIYFETRIEFIFEMVMEYPDSLLALNDLRKCISVLGCGIPMCEKLKSEVFVLWWMNL